jgi:hypothetical protein
MNLLHNRKRALLLPMGNYLNTKDTKVKTPDANPLSPFVFERNPE